MSISPEVEGHQRLPFLKYYDVLKLQNRFTLELNVAKNTCYIKKYFE